jgi:hypothetical protein
VKLSKLTLLTLTLATLAACTPESKEITSSFVLPEGLKDCKAYVLKDGNIKILYVVRCPNSQTSTIKTGKHPVHVSVVEE